MRHLIFPLTLTAAMLSLGVFVYGAYLHTIPLASAIATTAHTKTTTHAKRARHMPAKLLPELTPGLSPAESSFKLMQAGGFGLIVSMLFALVLTRSVLSTQSATAQSFLKDERKAWEKKQSVYDAQRDQLIAELQVAQTKKDEMDTLRQHASRQFQELLKRFLLLLLFCAEPQVSEASQVSENLEAITALKDTWAAIESARWSLAKQ